MASINIVLKAVDQYSSTITGLNQGFELVGKAINGIKAVADLAWSAVKTGAEVAFGGVQKALDLAIKGGAVAELRSQFQNLANGFGVDADYIINDLDNITLNMISTADAFRLAGQGIKAGLNEDELRTVFTFVKRDTEQTGESFEQMADTIIKALAKGRFTTLREFGLIIEKGDTVADVLRQMEEMLEIYGETAFNTGDKVNALTNQQTKFYEKLGEGINSSRQYQTVLTSITDTVINFVKSFDPKPITIFVDNLIVLIKDSLASAINSIPNTWKVWETVFKDSQYSAKTWGVAMVDVVFSVVKAAATGVNSVLDILSNAGIPQILSGIATSAITIIRGVLVSIPEAISSVIEVNIREISDYYNRLISLVENSAILSKVVGKDEINQAKELVNWLDDAATSAGKSADAIGSIDKIFATATSAINKAGVAISDSRISLDGLSESHAQFRTDVYRSLNDSVENTFAKTSQTLEKATGEYRGVLDLAKSSGEQVDIEKLFSSGNFKELNTELDDMIEKAKAPVEPAAALQTAATRATQPQGIEAATAGLNSQAVLLALGNWLLQHIVNKASTERAPMAILATN